LNIGGLIPSFGVRYHQYADDNQLYVAISKGDAAVQLEALEQCITSIYSYWLLHNGLALNPSKSEAIVFTSGRGNSCAVDISTVNVSGIAIQPADTVKSIDVVLHRRLSFDQQIDAVCKACYFHIRALCHVRDSLPDDVAITVACSIVSSRLDYCNALYAGISAKNFDKLQPVADLM
jgi:hypothetical protein